MKGPVAVLYARRDTARRVRPAVRRAVLVAAPALTVLLALAGAPPAAPARAGGPTVCTVDGVLRPGPDVVGTASADRIECSSVAAGHSVEGLGGADTLTLTGAVEGDVRGGPGDDTVLVLPGAGQAPRAGLHGDEGNDTIRIADGVEVSGLVDGGEGDDRIVVRGTVTPSGQIFGDEGDDDIHVHNNQGFADARPGARDVCVADMGSPCPR
ncbi:hypothetical protein [Streptomyces albireticuli]|uniref:Uncharacterized protein n=1 Tax=Streptomyces albireticuli TaxID=1940 RepID=A0A2A2D916_9ACTN|nr:hypothetical protein [Streptomyces albireticuli]MCD9144808.1 hypothetical protein [Streptomyces albireticuli]MCD9165677.1 hypothetical protein [Streptomyces albireticuli]MCD9193715.1 hypothetical protein [Streptomyces albireticuli]PAU47926.1 hypothetical protein CK936_15955 [Streptomyces albireticuli]